MHRQDYFSGHKNRIFEQSWHPDSGEAKAALVLVHGLAEHSGRYVPFARDLCEQQIEVFAYDQQGHGKSEGLRAYVDCFDDYVDDLNLVVKRVQARIGPRPLFIMGHSLGGAVVMKYVLDHQTDRVKGWIFSSASTKVHPNVSPLLQKLAPVIGFLFPKLATSPLQAAHISRDEKVVQAYVNDPLNYIGGIRARTGAEILKVAKIFSQRFSEVKAPVLLFHGTADQLTDPLGSQLAYEAISSKDKRLYLWEGLFHETLNEPERADVIEKVVEWILERC
ncbi:MAG TPA: lysophospholipase [Rhodothermales bacterium]|nr:lysophospholipase [Rhodothermales bacterium]HRR09486.1 lysophospholipase [Rhodothermales bacterium]